MTTIGVPARIRKVLPARLRWRATDRGGVRHVFLNGARRSECGVWRHQCPHQVEDPTLGQRRLLICQRCVGQVVREHEMAQLHAEELRHVVKRIRKQQQRRLKGGKR
jgi:hypothetical protein